MPYLPEAPEQSTVFPKAQGKDLHFLNRRIFERYSRFYPCIDWYPLLKGAAPVATPDTLSVEDPVTQTPFDPVYGESMQVGTDGQWRQPHLSATVDPATATPATSQDIEKFDGPFKVHAKVLRVNTEYQLKKYGFDEIRDLALSVPVIFFDRHGFQVSEGDYFVWDGREYNVVEDHSAGYWKNTNVRLYRNINAEYRRKGS